MAGKWRVSFFNCRFPIFLSVFGNCKSAILFWLLVLGPFVLGGCGSSGRGERTKGSRVDEIKQMPADEKKTALLKRLDRKFEDPEAHFELAQLYQADGLWSQAEYEYNTTLRFDPVHRQAQAAMVKVFLAAGDTTRAKTYADIYMNQVASSAMESLKLALAFQKQLLDEYALVCYRQALGLAPNSAKVHRQIGYYYLSKNNKVLAREYLVRSFQLDPSQPEVAGELGRLGVAVKIPRKTQKRTKKLDKIVQQAEKEK